MDNTKELTHISLCAGYGGIDIGLKRALGNVRTIAFSEIEAYALSNLVKKIEAGFLDTAPIWTNLKTFPWGDFKGKVDILSGGFPCQPFSYAGGRSADDDPRHLWPYITKGIKQLGKPPLVFLENVEGIISSKLKSREWSDPKGTPVLLHVLRELERLGYEATAGLFSAAEVGAPHQRKRVFILAVSNELRSSGRDIITSLINRKELGNSNSYGLCTDKKKFGGLNQASNGSKKREESSGNIKRSSRQASYRDLSAIQSYYSKEFKTAYPSFRGETQYEWEAPRTISKEEKLDDSNSKRREREALQGKPREQAKGRPSKSSAYEHIQRTLKPKVGGTVDGVANRLGTSKLFRCYDNRTDELRLLGNGVVPDTATRAFKTLWEELANSKSRSKGR